MKNITLFVLLLPVLFTACTGPKKSTNSPGAFAQRYNSMAKPIVKDYSDDSCLLDVKALAAVRQKIETTGAGSAKTVFPLTDRGQKELFDIFAQKDSAAQKRLIDLLNQTFQAPPQGDADQDYSEPTLAIILSVDIKDFYQDVSNLWSPADRIQSLRTSILLPDASKEFIQFNTWDKVQTQYATYNAGDISYTKNKTWNISPSATILGNSFSLGSYNLADDASASDSVKYSVVTMTGTLTADSLAIKEQGSPSQSLFGNTTLSITPQFKNTIASPRFEFSGLTSNKGFEQDVTKIKASQHFILYPQIPKDGIKAILKIAYEIRHVANHAETIAEGDDDIQFYTGHHTQTITLIKFDDVTPVSWDIQNVKNGNRVSVYDTLTGELYEIKFDNYKAAQGFYNWLFAVAPTIDKFIQIGGYKLIESYDWVNKKPVFLNKTNFEKASVIIKAERI